MAETTETKTHDTAVSTPANNGDTASVELGNQPIDDMNTSAIAVAGFLGGMLTVAVIVALQVVYYYFAGFADMEKQTDAPDRNMAGMRTEQLNTLNRTGWIDREAGTVKLSVDDATMAVMRDLNHPKAE